LAIWRDGIDGNPQAAIQVEWRRGEFPQTWATIKGCDKADSCKLISEFTAENAALISVLPD
jgi:hypothetical protein